MAQVTDAMLDFIRELADDFANHPIGDQYPRTRLAARKVSSERWRYRYIGSVISEMEDYYRNKTEPPLLALGNWIEKLRG